MMMRGYEEGIKTRDDHGDGDGDHYGLRMVLAMVTVTGKAMGIRTM